MRASQVLVLMGLFLLFSCKKEEKVNPYDSVIQQVIDQTPSGPTPDPASIAGLHQAVFAPTCANSGCHDGTFEPDFRTIESSYNTLVRQSIIKNNPAGTYEFRVLPGDADNSILYRRLIEDIDGQSGIMPLATEPGSTWEAQRETHIQNLRAWINNGAKDVYGNSPVTADLPPILQGIFITAQGSLSPFPRNVQSGSIEIPLGTPSVDVYLACSDDQLDASQLTYLKALVGSSINDFSAVSEQDVALISEQIQTGYSGNPVSFRFRFGLNLSGIQAGIPQFIRFRVQDAAPSFTELPSNSGADYIKVFYSFQRGS